MATDPSYTVFIRLPFAREDFVDPPSVEWDAVKDKALWKILSKASKNSDIDWSELATRFEVSLSFLLQQAAWLYERQLLQVRAQMRKVGASKSNAPSPVPGSTSETTTGGESMRRTGSGGAGRPQPTAVPSKRDSLVSKPDSTTSIRTPAPPLSRNTSGSTIPTRSSPRPVSALPYKPTSKGLLSSPPAPDALTSPEPSSSSSSSSDSDSSPVPATNKSHLFRRPKFTTQKSKPLRSTALSDDADNDDDEGEEEEEEDDDDDDAPAFAFTPDPSATLTLRSDGRHQSQQQTAKRPLRASQTSDSSASEVVAPTTSVPSARTRDQRRPAPPAGPLSPRRTAELKGSPAMRGQTGSEGSPSMGSSFSDLDDASVTQSALEEALASNMQAGGGMASRMSSISQALRSKYL